MHDGLVALLIVVLVLFIILAGMDNEDPVYQKESGNCLLHLHTFLQPSPSIILNNNRIYGTILSQNLFT